MDIPRPRSARSVRSHESYADLREQLWNALQGDRVLESA